MTQPAVVGRDDVLAAATRALTDGRSVLLVGPAGIGKSTLLEVLRAETHHQGCRVLAATPAEPDAQLPFLTLIDLLAPVSDTFFDRLSGAARQALDAALYKHEAPSRAVDRVAVRIGVLELLRLLAQDRPTVLVIDDVQWVDPASAEVLGFALRRLVDVAASVLATERLSAGEVPTGRTWLPDPAVRLPVGPLPDEALLPILLDRAGALITRGTALQISQLAGGNPFLALEIADALRRSGVRPVLGEPLPVPAVLDALIRQRLASLPDSAQDTLRVAAAAARPTLTLLRRAGCATAVDDVAAACTAQLADLGVDGSVRFEHPLVRAAVYADAATATRMALHARLAEAVLDPIERARHLALATLVEDETVAAALSDAAALARRRGAADTAFELAGLAAQRTPEHDRDGWARRTVTQAWHAYAAGLEAEATSAANDVLGAEVSRQLRARAWLVILEVTGQRIGQADDQIRAAAAESAGDPETEHLVAVHIAWHHIAAGRFQDGLSAAMRAVDLARAAGDAQAELRALEAANAALHRLGQDTSAVMARSDSLVQRADVGGLAWLIHYEKGRDLLEQDRFVEAVDVLRRAIAVAADDPALVLESDDAQRFLRKVELRLGNCATALALATRSHLINGDTNLALGGLAEAELAGGSVTRAESFAHQAIAASLRVGDHDSLLWYWHLLTACRLLAGDPAGAIGYARKAEECRGEEGLTNRVRLLRADLVEALARVGDLAEASTVLAELTAPAARPPSPSTGAAIQRAQAILLRAQGQPDAAAELLAGVLGVQRERGMRLEEVRTLLAAAEVERRRRRRAAARALLEEARDICVATQALPWLARVEAELAPSTRNGDEELTPMEERIVAMVVRGATNREIATALALGLSTVEGSLSHVYRKLGARSRVELVRMRQSSP